MEIGGGLSLAGGAMGMGRPPLKKREINDDKIKLGNVAIKTACKQRTIRI